MVTLQEFVKETLREIAEGVKEAQTLPGIGGNIAPTSLGGMKFPESSGVYFEARILATTVKFDVVVSAEVSKSGEAGAGISVSVLSLKGGGSMAATDRTENRIQFAVPLVFPRNSQSWNPA